MASVRPAGVTACIPLTRLNCASKALKRRTRLYYVPWLTVLPTSVDCNDDSQHVRRIGGSARRGTGGQGSDDGRRGTTLSQPGGRTGNAPRSRGPDRCLVQCCSAGRSRPRRFSSWPCSRWCSSWYSAGAAGARVAGRRHCSGHRPGALDTRCGRHRRGRRSDCPLGHGAPATRRSLARDDSDTSLSASSWSVPTCSRRVQFAAAVCPCNSTSSGSRISPMTASRASVAVIRPPTAPSFRMRASSWFSS